MSSSISTSYDPEAYRGVSRVFSNWLVNLGGNSAYNVLSEYYPDMMRSLFQRHRKPLSWIANTAGARSNPTRALLAESLELTPFLAFWELFR
ncbi:MAG TPA: hypothetical protein VE957_01200 [Terriglobales bacterium]|nr:hypothetical protein [Terriglobales bacterium]